MIALCALMTFALQEFAFSLLVVRIPDLMKCATLSLLLSSLLLFSASTATDTGSKSLDFAPVSVLKSQNHQEHDSGN